MMKKKSLMFCLFLLVFCGFNTCYANIRGEEVINMHHIGNHGTHYNLPVPADQPDVYYNNVSQTIIIDGTGEVNYYDVEILSLTSFDVVISTQVNGYYDTIDVSSLSDGEYTIFIYSPTGYTFDGDFEIY